MGDAVGITVDEGGVAVGGKEVEVGGLAVDVGDDAEQAVKSTTAR